MPIFIEAKKIAMICVWAIVDGIKIVLLSNFALAQLLISDNSVHNYQRSSNGIAHLARFEHTAIYQKPVSCTIRAVILRIQKSRLLGFY